MQGVQDIFVAMLCILAHALLLHLSLLCAVGIMAGPWAGHPRFDFEQEHESFSSPAFRPALGLTQPHVQ
jgi:hypothetical protein